MFGKPAKPRGPDYDIYAGLISLIIVAALMAAVVWWALSTLD